MRSLRFAALVPIVCALGCGANWQKFELPDGSAKVLMPGTPVQENKSSHGVSMAGHKVRVGNVEYAIATVDMPAQAATMSAEQILQRTGGGFMPGGLRAEDGQTVTHKGQPARELTVTDPKGTQARMRVALTPGNRKLVMVIVAVPKGHSLDSVSSNTRKFFDSLEIAGFSNVASNDSPDAGAELAMTDPASDPAAIDPASDPAAVDPATIEPPLVEPATPDDPAAVAMPVDVPPAAVDPANPGADPANPNPEGNPEGTPQQPGVKIAEAPTAAAGTAEYAVQLLLIKLHQEDLTGLDAIVGERAEGSLPKLRDGSIPQRELEPIRRQLSLVQIIGARDLGRTTRVVAVRNALGQTISFQCRKEADDVFRIQKVTVQN